MRSTKKSELKLRSKAFMMKQHIFLTCISSRKRLTNRKQQQTDSDCSLFVTDLLLCSEYIRYILWSAHMIHLYLHSNYIQTELSVLHSELYALSSLTWSSFFTHIEKDLSSFSSHQLISKKSQLTMLTWTWWNSRNLTVMMKQTQQQQQEKKFRSKISYKYAKKSRVSY